VGKYFFLNLFLICFTVLIFGQSAQIIYPNDSISGQPVEPEFPVVIIDTAAVLKELNFPKFSYDSLFTASSNAGEQVLESQIHIRKRDVLLPVLLLIMLVYVTWLRYVFSKELSENFTVILNNNLGQQIYRDREFSANIFKLLTFVNFTLTAGIFLFLLATYFKISLPFENMIYNILASIGLIILLYIVKGFWYAMISAAFKIGPQISFFRFNAQVIYHLLGIALLPFVILAAFAEPPVSNWSLLGAAFLILFGLLLRLFKGMAVMGTFDRFHIVYFLLYICALEIAPILIAVKLFSTWG